MEYNRAVERGIPRLIFLMHDDHPLKAADVEKGEGAIKLEEFKKRVGPERVANYFKSPAELRANVIDTLSHRREPDVTAFHYVSDIPAPPEAYIAHPYTLLQSKGLIGRQAELNLLTDWVAKPGAEVYQARILNVVAIGGMGKSALTWKWFNDIAPQEMRPLAGRMWWSFYESDASFENFVTRALAYVTRRPREEVEKIPPFERETQLLAALDREPYLIVLDGLERILIAYARMDVAHVSDEKIEREIQEASSRRSPRKTSDPRAGRFLQKLAQVRQSRVLVSSRLFPADLETSAEEPLPGCFRLRLEGLSDSDAVELWRAFGVSGSRDILLPLFSTFGKHPLLIQALAGEIKRYRPAPGDFDRWLKDNPRFSPSQFPRIQEAMAHVLEFALRGLEEASLKVLHTVAAFRMPASYDTLAGLLVGDGRLFPNAMAMDSALAGLEDRGLLGWDRRANRYDLHPIVRNVVWSGLDDDTRRGTYEALETHFKSLPAVDPKNVNSLQDLTSAIELYNTLIGLGRYDDAIGLFYERLNKPMLFRLCASRQLAELLEMLFPDGVGQMPALSRPSDRGFTLNALAVGYELIGQPGRAAPLCRMGNALANKEHDRKSLSISLRNHSRPLRLSGALRESEAAARRALSISRKSADAHQEALNLRILGLSLAARGKSRESEAALEHALRIHEAEAGEHAQGLDAASLAQRALWLGDATATRTLANHAWDLIRGEPLERGFIRAARLQGAAVLALDDLATANERLHHALSRARAVNYVEEELPALTALAELRRKQGNMKAARELLDDVWELAERGPYPLFHADALNVQAQIERDAGNRDAAVEAATKAYRLAWCDGPPFAYHWGLEAARAHLKALDAPEPTDLLPYDESRYEPMPEVEINPPDEFSGKQ